MAVTDASQRGHFKVQTTELLSPNGDFYALDVSQAASIFYYTTTNSNIVGGSMQVKADDNTLGAGTGQPLGVRIAEYSGQTSWTQLSDGALKLYGGHDDQDNPQHFWNGKGPKSSTPLDRILTASFDSQEWIFAPGGVPQSSSLAGPGGPSGFLTNEEIASQVQRIVNNLPADFAATLDGAVVNVQNQNGGAAGNNVSVVNNVLGGTPFAAVGMGGGANAIPGTPETTSGGRFERSAFF